MRSRSQQTYPGRRRAALLACAAFLLAGACSDDSKSETAGAPGAAKAPASTSMRFTDVLGASGITFRHHFLDSENGTNYRINPYDHGSGVCVADVDGDGRDDIYLLDFLGPNALYVNRGQLKFEDVTTRAGVAVDRALGVGAAFGDFDSDGDQDLYVTTYRGGNHLFRNDGTGAFEDVTAAAAVGYTGHSNGATWLDYDLDGDLDLYLCNIGKFTTETISEEADYFYSGVALPFSQVAQTPDARVPGESDVLYRNDGGGKFTDVTKAAGITSSEWNGDVAAADIDLDGDIDLYVSNMFGANHLFRNKGDGTFEEITTRALGRTSWGGMGAIFFDGNGDELPDLYVVDMHSDMWVKPDKPEQVVEHAKFNTPLGTSVGGSRIIASADDTQAKSVLFGNTYFENQGGGLFLEKSAQAGLETWWPWGIAAGDLDNDGDEDLFVPSGMGFPYYYWPNQLLENSGSGVFTEVARAAGVEPPARGENIAGAEIRGQAFTRSSRSAALSDLDGDGDLDLIVNNFSCEPYLLRNDSPARHWLEVKLVGKSPDGGKCDAWGARVRVRAGGKTWTRQLACAQGYLAQSSSRLHFGLGDATAVESVEVFWPGKTTPQRASVSGVDQVVQIAQE